MQWAHCSMQGGTTTFIFLKMSLSVNLFSLEHCVSVCARLRACVFLTHTIFEKSIFLKFETWKLTHKNVMLSGLLLFLFYVSVYMCVGIERHLGVIPLLVRGLYLCQLKEDSIWGTAASLWGWKIWGTFLPNNLYLYNHQNLRVFFVSL